MLLGMEKDDKVDLERLADEFLRAHGEEPPKLRPWSEELRVARQAARAHRGGNRGGR